MTQLILFAPSNPSHVATQLPVAKEMVRRGYKAVFLSRDTIVNEEYRVEPFLNGTGMQIIRYDSYYKPDLNLISPRLFSYLKFGTELSGWLSTVDADAVVVCNDDAALFDRMVVELFRRAGKHAFLIQESVRPAIRRIPLYVKLKEQGGRGIFLDLYQKIVFRLGLGPFFRKGYAHSSNIYIFTAGIMFRNQLIAEGVDESRIIVTGQPRLDGRVVGKNRFKSDKVDNKTKTILYCSQPVKCSLRTQEKLFIDIVDTIDRMHNVKLIVKLHPRDCPESHWLHLLRADQGKSLIEITRTRQLSSCFEMSDAFITIASTTCLEAMDYGLPVGLIDYLPLEWHLPYSNLGGVISIKSRMDLYSSIDMLLFNESLCDRLREGSEKVLWNELYLRDGKSACRIADSIEKLIN